MPGGVHRFANGCKVARNARRGFGLEDKNRSDLMLSVSVEALLNRLSRHAGPVFNLQPVNLDAVRRGDAAKRIAEVAVHTAQHLVAGRKRIDDAGFPTSGARAGEEEDLTLSGLKELF